MGKALEEGEFTTQWVEGRGREDKMPRREEGRKVVSYSRVSSQEPLILFTGA